MYYIPTDYENSYYPLDRYEMQRRQRAHEHARRLAYEKQCREAALRRRAYEEELARREEENYRKIMHQREAVRQAQLGKERAMRMGYAEEEDDEYVVARGPGGYLYQVHRADLERPKQNTRTVRTQSHAKEAENHKEKKKSKRLAFSLKELQDTVNLSQVPAKATKPSKNKKRVTVIVEDASDSETEEDEIKSVWRNRHPSPGESWMEPISF